MSKIPDCHPDRKHFGTGLCGPCYRVKNKVSIEAYNKEWRKTKKDQYRQIQLRTLNKRAGVTQEQVDILTEQQKGCCAICKQPAKLYRDHNHQTNKFRGLLCHWCNSGIGSLKDSIEILQGAIQYLNENSV